MSQPLVSFRQPPPPLCSFLFVLVLLVAAFYTLHHPPDDASSSPPHLFSPNPLSLRRLFLSSASNATVSSYLRALTRRPHLAGTKPSLDTLTYVLNHFQSLGLGDDTRVAEYEALSYPRTSPSRRVSPTTRQQSST
ncbi:hypothetical protein Bca52824_008454 [Brassica carinata]|uniref:Uncharacterized protein n=1 Tax=Brassica carinata TaxID=52824 RepID=A0A8X7W9A2_BRACI|nr:hypothetical protein Bca52824_008454 [Brassica carinata]